MAKQVLKEWFDNTKEDINERKTIKPISFRSNRKSGVFLEYPICKNIKGNYYDGSMIEDTYIDNSWIMNWDEINGGSYDEYIPTYDECINEFNTYPIAIIDVVISHKGSPCCGIEICHTNPVSFDKIQKLKEIGVFNLIEINADWILNQVKIPSELIYKTLI